MQKEMNLKIRHCEHLTGCSGGTQKKINLKNSHCEERSDVAISYLSY